MVESNVVPYERQLDSDLGFAMSEGARHFEGTSEVHLALRKITKRLDELGIPYAVAGGMALFAHGFRRFTEDVDVLVTPEGLKEIHRQLDGLGYVRRFERSKNLRDVEHKVRIEFLITGQYPGDGKPKPVSFPDPSAVAEDRDGVKYLNLKTIIELKLASGISSAERVKDLGDVQELIKLLALPRDLGNQLSEYVRQKYDELWLATREVPRRYVLLWRNKHLTSEAANIDDMIKGLREAAETLEAMKRDGVTLDPEGGTADDYAYLVTSDPNVASKYGMEDEKDLWGDDEVGGDDS